MAIHLAPSGRTYTIPEEVAAEIVGLRNRSRRSKRRGGRRREKGGK